MADNHAIVNEFIPLRTKQASGEGIGIFEFFDGKNIFITGATGFLGKVVVEKLVRSTSVSKIYLLIKANDADAASQRLTKEIIYSNLFNGLREKHGKSYEEFARKKLILIAGNICEPNFGMDPSKVDEIRKNVDVIIESAAITSFNERYDLMLDANVMAPKRLMDFAKSCKNLRLFTHISTAYVNTGGNGIMVPETIGDYARNDNIFSPLMTDSAHEIKIASEHVSTHNITKELKALGQERATLYGWENTYQLSMAMGEMTLDENRGDIPLLIIRPSIIESTYKDPYPGWIQGTDRMLDPFISLHAKGQLPSFPGDPDSYMDLELNWSFDKRRNFTDLQRGKETWRRRKLE